MSKIEQILNYVKNISEKYNLIAANAKKLEELPTVTSVNSEDLLLISQLEDEVWKSKKIALETLFESLSLSGQDNKIREVILGEITEAHDLNYLLDNNGIIVSETEIIILTVLVSIDQQLLQRQFIWKLGKGEFNPIGSEDTNTKLLELQPKFINEIIAEELTSSPSAIVHDFGIITEPILDVVNTANPARNYTDDEKIYYIRATNGNVNLLYNFKGVNGIYGEGELQMTNEDLVLVYSSSNANVLSLIQNKLDKGSYIGTAEDLDKRLLILELPDVILKSGKPIINDLNISGAEGLFEWRINREETLNPDAFSLDATSATEGYYCFAILQGSQDGMYSIKMGDESLTINSAPIADENHIKLCEMLIFGNTIQSIINLATDGKNYIEKIEKDGIPDYISTGTNAFIPAAVSGQGKLIVYNNSLISINGIDFTEALSSTTAEPYNGKEFIIINRTGADITLNNEASKSTNQANFLLDGGIDLIVPNDGMVSFYNFNETVLSQQWKSFEISSDKTYVDAQDAQVLSDANDYTDTEVATSLSTANAYTDSKVTSLYKVKGSVADYASLPSSGQVIGDVWNLTDTGMNYVWTGSAWDALGTTVDISGKEDTSNKTATLIGNESSTSLFLNILGFVNAIKNSLYSLLTAKTALVDADGISIFDSVDSSKTKFISWANFKSLFKTVNSTSIIGSGDIIIPSKVPNTYFINSSTGVNATGVYEDATKPFATIDYVTSLGSYAGGIFVLQNAGNFPINNTLPNFNVAFKSDVACNIVLSGMTTTFMSAGSAVIIFDIPLGNITNERSGGAGTYINAKNTIINCYEIYHNSSSKFFWDYSYVRINVKKLSIRTGAFFSNANGNITTNSVVISELVCLANSSVLTEDVKGLLKVYIGQISGAGSLLINGGRWEIGNISTTGTCIVAGNQSTGYTYINFLNSVITSSGGFSFGNLGGGVGNVYTGNILSSPSLTMVNRGSTNTGIDKFLNFSANLLVGTFNFDFGKLIFENCSIRSTNSPITIVNSGTPNASIEILNSTFKVTNAVPLITGGSGGTNTVEIGGVSTNATMISDQIGTGVTVTQMTNY